MNKKRIIIIYSTIAAVALTVVLSSLIVSCCNNRTIQLSQIDGTQIITSVAENYYNSHKNYENYADMTFTAHGNYEDVEIKKLEYKHSHNDTETSISEFTNKENKIIDFTINVKNYDNNICFCIDINLVEKSKKFTVNTENILETTTVDKTTMKKYIMVTKTINNQVNYYITHFEKIINSGNENTTKEYYKFSGRDDYIEQVGNYLEKFNAMIEDAYLGMFSSPIISTVISLGSSIKFFQRGNKFEMSYQVAMPTISNGIVTTTMSNYKNKCVNRQINEVVSNSVIKATSGNSTEINLNYQVLASSNSVQLPNLSDYILSGQVIEIGEIMDATFD